MTNNIKIEETSEKPVCPFCEQTIEVILKLSHGGIEKHKIYICPHCKKILSIGFNEWT